MTREQVITILGQWQGYSVGSVERIEDTFPRVYVELIPEPGHPMICDRCGGKAAQIHDYKKRCIRDLPLLGADTYLIVLRRRVRCPRCGPSLERLDWLDRYARVTRRLADSVARLCAELPVKQAADWYRLKWDQVKAIDQAHLIKRLDPVDLSGVRVIAMDEFSLHRGQRYATVIFDPEAWRVLWVGRGHGRADIRPFFELLGEKGRKRLRAVAMDMNGAYAEEVHAQSPQVEIVYDRFHAIAKYSREVIDPVRISEANRLPRVKGARWLVLRNPKTLREKDRENRAALLSASPNLATVVALREELDHLWDFRSTKAAVQFLEQWFRKALESHLEPLITFSHRLEPYVDGILAHSRWPFNTGVMEGINNKIKLIKRKAYGYRDDAYFFLKIRGAFSRSSR